jgi:hypothetical protein
MDLLIQRLLSSTSDYHFFVIAFAANLLLFLVTLCVVDCGVESSVRVYWGLP